MTREQISNLETLLRSRGIGLHGGLSDQQLEQAQRRYGFRFPPDLAGLLSCFVPCSHGFYDWADQSRENETVIKKALSWPAEGILFDVEHNSFWMEAWGERPARMEEALRVAGERLANTPALVPIRSHRYLPGLPCEAGNPVLSVYQTDIIYYGSDLYEFFYVEFGLKTHAQIQFQKIKQGIPFWGELLE